MLTVYGAKAGQAQQTPPTIAADTVASISKIKILYILYMNTGTQLFKACLAFSTLLALAEQKSFLFLVLLH